MGVFKWLRRERVSITSRRVTTPEPAIVIEKQSPETPQDVGTIRTEKYKTDLAEFQARRSSGPKERFTTPDKKPRREAGRLSLPVSCTNCANDVADTTFNYEKKSAQKYQKNKTHRRSRSSVSEERPEAVPNIQFLFSNQVFMPGNVFNYSGRQHDKKPVRRKSSSHQTNEMEFLSQRQIDFDEDNAAGESPPLFFKNNSLPFDVQHFLEGSLSPDDEQESEEVSCVVEKVVLKTVNGVTLDKRDAGDNNDSSEDKLSEVMSELRNFDKWADEQLKLQTLNSSKSEDGKSDSSSCGLPLVAESNLDITVDKTKVWNSGKWGVAPVQIKKLRGVTMEQVRRQKNVEVNILRKCRHPNIVLLMGIYADVNNTVHLVCESCTGTLYGILHHQGRILSVQTAVQYTLDVALALVFLHMQGYIHGGVNSSGIMLTRNNVAKLADLSTCAKFPSASKRNSGRRSYDYYSPEPQYVNIDDVRDPEVPQDCEPLLSNRSSEAYLTEHAVPKPYKEYKEAEHYRWQAPEMFQPDEDEKVYPCSKSDVYALSLILWECCNAAIPWKTLSYDKLKELYVLWKTGIRLPQDGTYPGCLLELLQHGLKLERSARLELSTMVERLQVVKSNLEQLDYIIIAGRVSKKQSDFSSANWSAQSPTDSDAPSSYVAQSVSHKAVVHQCNSEEPATDKDELPGSPGEVIYETIRKESHPSPDISKVKKCFLTDDESDSEDVIRLSYSRLAGNIPHSSNCSTPVSKTRVKMRVIGTPGANLHRSDSTEYCTIFSPDNRNEIQNVSEEIKGPGNSATKLSRSFTPRSYRPLHITVPKFNNLESLKALPKEKAKNGSYNFDIKNYSLPSTPIARSNKLRKNAWLSGSGDLNEAKVNGGCEKQDMFHKAEVIQVESAPDTPITRTEHDDNKERNEERVFFCESDATEIASPSADTERMCNGPKKSSPVQEFSFDADVSNSERFRSRSHSWSYRSTLDRADSSKLKAEDDMLAQVNVKPLVAIHERWIYEANRRTSRAHSLPEEPKVATAALKPASHCVDTLQSSLQHPGKRSPCPRRRHVSPSAMHAATGGPQSEQFNQARDLIAKSVNFHKEPDYFENKLWRREQRKCFSSIKPSSNHSTSSVESEHKYRTKVDQATETNSIDEFVRQLIRKEFNQMIQEAASDGTSEKHSDCSAEIMRKGTANVVDALKLNSEKQPEGFLTTQSDNQLYVNRKEAVGQKSFSRVKINGNNKPLLQITFSRSGENSLQVMDNCVNVTFSDANGSKTEKMTMQSEEPTSTEDHQSNSLKRCQTFTSIQEARSTEDLYIDDELSTHMEENFGGKVKLIPLHGSLHEILCEKQDECCLVKVRQENGCDTIYFRCDNSDTESRDAVDGTERDKSPKDTVVYKRSISLVEERIERVYPKDNNQKKCAAKESGDVKRSLNMHRPKSDDCNVNRPKSEDLNAHRRKSEGFNGHRPKSEVFVPTITQASRLTSRSTPSLVNIDEDRDFRRRVSEAHVNIDNVMCYQDSSSDESLKCHLDADDFETLEKRIEEDFSFVGQPGSISVLEKISEENLSIINDEMSEKEITVSELNEKID